jgi:hypothetical protein
MKIFIEKQKFTQPLVIIGLLLAFIATAYTTVLQLKTISGGDFGEILKASLGIIIMLLVTFFIFSIKLKTRIDEKGVYYQFFPIHFSYKFIPWNTLDKCYIRNYNAITEYGGWGFRFSFFRKRGKAFNVKGDIGLQLVLKNGEKILIGTQKKDELQRTIDTYKNKIINNNS